MRETKRYLGLELAGAKNQKTSLAVLEYYPREQKTFLLDSFDKISVQPDETSDEALLHLIDEVREGVVYMGVNVPLVLPPCITCSRKTCPPTGPCGDPAALWMKRFTQRIARKNENSNKLRTFTAYTQRPVELWIRHKVFPELPKTIHFEIDETLGGNRAPLTARMHFLKRHLENMSLVEIWPKLTVAVLCAQLGLPHRVGTAYRHLEDGAHFREEILTRLAEDYQIFIYERDLHKLSASLTSFDAFICAFTALLCDKGDCVKIPKGFPISSGWVHYPA